MKTSTFLLGAAMALSLGMSLTGCKKFPGNVGYPHPDPQPPTTIDSTGTDSTACINFKISQLAAEPVRNPPAKVYQYQYNGQTVYYIPAYCCDAYSELLDANCNVICHPDGGITGGGDGNCSNFFATRTNEVLLWQDNR